MKSIILILFCIGQIHGQELKEFDESVSKDGNKISKEKNEDKSSNESHDQVSSYTAGLAASLIMDLLEPVIDTAVTRSIYFIAGIPAPDIGRYPYANKVPFNDASSSHKVRTYGIFSTGYQDMLNGVKSWRGEVRTGANGGYFQINIQTFHENTINYSINNLTKIGLQIGMVKRIPNTYLTWEIITGVSGLERKKPGLFGGLIGAGLRYYFPMPVAIECKTSYHFFGKGRNYHEESALASLFYKRLEIQIGYQQLTALDRISLKGPFINARFYVTLETQKKVNRH